MKQLLSTLLLSTFTIGLVSTAQAATEEAWNLLADIEVRAAQCANNDKDKSKISDITKKVNMFGTWKGTLNEKKIVATLFKDANGTYKGKASLDDSDYGPYTIKICDDNGSFYGVVFGYEAPFVVLSKTKIKVTSPLDASETVELTRQ
jgi:hypothetical protein